MDEPTKSRGWLVAVFAVFHGHAHGTELPHGSTGITYSAGFVVSTGCLHAVGIGIGTVHKYGWGKNALRVAGFAVLAGGVYFLQSALFGAS